MKLSFQGRLSSVQPRIRLTRSFDERQHEYLGYVLGIHGTVGDGAEPRDLRVGIGEAAQAKHAFQVGDKIKGEAEAVPDPRREPVDYYKAAALEVVERSANTVLAPPPWHGAPSAIAVYRARGHRRLAVKTYESECSSCVWGCRMAVELIRDHWKPTVGVTYRIETFCYGPKSCRLYKAGPPRRAPGRKGMVWLEEDWVDEAATSRRGPDE